MTVFTESEELEAAEPFPQSIAEPESDATQPSSIIELELSECNNIDLNDIVVDLTPMLARLLGSDIQLYHELDTDIGVVWGEAGLLEQVIVNLAVSARGAMPNGGTLSITTEIMEDMLDAHRTPKGVRLTVSDSGKGTDATNLLKACDPDLTSKPISTSLTAASKIVQMHKGVISIKSEMGHGTDISVELPYSAQPINRAVQHLHTHDENTPIILLAEEVYGARSRVYSILTKAGYKVFNAHNGQNAIEILEASTSKIDLCLFDVSMQQVSGAEAFNIMKQKKLDVPVIFIAGCTNDVVDGDEELQHVFKPFSRANILARVNSSIGAANNAMSTK